METSLNGASVSIIGDVVRYGPLHDHEVKTDKIPRATPSKVMCHVLLLLSLLLLLLN